MVEKWSNIAIPAIDGRENRLNTETFTKKIINGGKWEVIVVLIQIKDKKITSSFLVNSSEGVCSWRPTCHECAHTLKQVSIAVFFPSSLFFNGKDRKGKWALIQNSASTKLKHHNNSRKMRNLLMVAVKLNQTVGVKSMELHISRLVWFWIA